MEVQALKWWHVRWGLAARFAIVAGKIIGALCLIVAVALGGLYMIQPWLSSHRLGKLTPQLSIIPVSLSSEAEAPSSNSSIERYGFKFRLPNKEIVRTTYLEQVTLVGFPNGTMEFHRPLRGEDSIAFRSLHSDNDAEKLLSQDMLQSQFKLIQAAMLVTPEQVKWWRFRSSQNERAQLLLFLKFITLTEFSPAHVLHEVRPLYTIASGDFRGFQLGNPGVPPYDTRIDLFDGADRHLSFDVISPKGYRQVLTQEEINAIVASIRPVSDR